MPKDLYLILGIRRSATQREIREAHRRLAKRYHPDQQEGATRDFVEMQQAYQTLSDPARRRDYDASLHNSAARRRPPGPEPEPLIPGKPKDKTYVEPLVPEKPKRGAPIGPVSDAPPPITGALADLHTVGAFFQDLFASRSNHYFGGALRGGADVYEGEVTIGSLDAAHGGQLSLRIPTQRVCGACRGWGGSSLYLCSLCGGTGIVEKEIPLTIDFSGPIRDGETWRMPLDRYGIPNHTLAITFRVADG